MVNNHVANASADVENVSLRGTLAQDYAEAIEMGASPVDALKLILKAAKGNISSYVVGDTRIIGKSSERYQYPPDW